MQHSTRLSSSSSSSTSAMAAADEEATLLAPAPPAAVVVVPLHQQHHSAQIPSASAKLCDDVDMSKATFIQVAAVLAADLSSLGMGFILGYSAIALPQLQHPESWLPVSEDEASWIASLPALTLSIGCLLAGCLMEKFGRKRTMQIQCIPTLLGWVLLAMSKDVPTLYAGRLLTGFGGGMVDSTIQVYIGEITTPRLRGALASTPCLSFSLGMLVVYAMGAFRLQWNLVAALCAVVPLLALIAMFLLPESPVWLQAQGRHSQADDAMLWLRRTPQECQDLRAKENAPAENEVSALGSMFSRSTARPLALLLALFFFQQFCGMNAVVFYAVRMFQAEGGREAADEGGLDEHQAAVVVAATRLVVMSVACALLTRCGRRPVALLSGLGMAAAMIFLGVLVYVQGAPSLPVVLACVAAFIAANTFGFFFVPWIMLGELLPERCRGLASGMLSAVVYIYIFVIVKCYPAMLALFGQAVVFWVFGLVSALGTVFVYFCLPETKGKSLDEIEQSFKSKK